MKKCYICGNGKDKADSGNDAGGVDRSSDGVSMPSS